MAIRFRCARCQQPIEVDDVLAGQLARCPFCESVVHVPAESALDIDQIATARPAEGASFPPPPPGISPVAMPPLPGSPSLPMPPLRGSSSNAGLNPTAIRFGNSALICTALAAGMFLVSLVRMYGHFVQAMKTLGLDATQQLTSQQVQGIMDATAAAAQSDGYIQGLSCGLLFFVVAAMVFALISLRQQRAGNWRAWLSVGVCSMALLCVCASVLLNLAGLSPRPG